MNNVDLATKELAAKEFMNSNSVRDMKLYKNERKRAKSLLVDILDANLIKNDFIDKEKEEKRKMQLN